MAARKIDGKWYADFRYQQADGRIERIRKRSPIQSKAGAQEFEHQLRTELAAPLKPKKEVPTFATYADEFMKTYAAANNKPSEQDAKERMLKHHLLPAFGERKLDAIGRHQIETLKADLLTKGTSKKHVNNILACLGKMLRYAQEIEVIASVPKIKLLKVPPQKFDFLTYEEFARVLDATKHDPLWYALLLIGAEAGLRQGEMIALRWEDVDLVAGNVTVRRSSWYGVIDSPKSGKDRKIPLTGTHVLRHTFCSHLAMRGAAPKAIQDLAGHSTLTMTLRYMHLAPSALREAIGLLDFGQPVGSAQAAGA